MISFVFRSLVAALLLSTVSLSAELIESKSPRSILERPSKAKVRIVNVWATWCQPCVIEMIDLKALDAEFPDGDVEFLGFSFDDMIPGERAETKKRVLTFLDRRKISWPVLYYTGTLSDVQDFFSFEGEIPLTVVYDRNGKELARHQGKIVREDLARTIRRLVAAQK